MNNPNLSMMVVVVAFLVLSAVGVATSIQMHRPVALFVFAGLGVFLTLVLASGWYKDED